MERVETDILVVGGGVAGLTATAAFAGAGFRTLCVDPVPPVTEVADPGSDLRSTAFLMPSVRLLERAGLWARLAPHAAELRVMRLADAGGAEPVIRETADFEAREVGEAVFGYNLPNWLLRREMVARIGELPGSTQAGSAPSDSTPSGATLRGGVGLIRLTPRMREAIAVLSDGSQVRARLVVAADGRDSTVRRLLGIGARRWSHGQRALVFTVRHERPHEGVSTEIHRSGGPFTLVPLPDHDGAPHSAVVWMESGPRAAALAELPVEAFEDALNARGCGVLGRLGLASPRRVWPIITQVADRLYGPRAALVAEAAHVIPPIGAQGLNMSLRDIATLLDLSVAAREAGGDIGAPEGLAAYARARHPDILARIAGVEVLNRAAMTDVQALRDLRRTGLRLLFGLGPLRTTAMRLGLGAGRTGG